MTKPTEAENNRALNLVGISVAIMILSAVWFGREITDHQAREILVGLLSQCGFIVYMAARNAPGNKTT